MAELVPKPPDGARKGSVEGYFYLSVALGLSLLHNRLDLEDVKNNHIRATAKDLISTRKDIQEFVLWLRAPDVDEKEEEDHDVENLEGSFKAPPIPPNVSPSDHGSKQDPSRKLGATTKLLGTASTVLEAHDSLAGTGRSQSQGGTLFALLRAYDEHSHEPDVQQAIKYVASFL